MVSDFHCSSCRGALRVEKVWLSLLEDECSKAAHRARSLASIENIESYFAALHYFKSNAPVEPIQEIRRMVVVS
jgi:hypothetical protein